MVLDHLGPCHSTTRPGPMQQNRVRRLQFIRLWGDRKDCHVKIVKYLTTEEELRSAVAYANKNKLKLKVVSKFSHTIPKLVCPSSSDSLISTAKYNYFIQIDSNSTVTADAGMALRDLIDQVEKFGLSLVAAHIGRVMIVPANESEGYAKVIQIGPQDQLLNAAKVSLGVLGVISKSTKSVAGKCTLAATTLSYKKLIANGLKNNGQIFTGYPVVGRQDKMQTSGSCLYSSTTRIDASCAWDPRIKGLFFYESTAIFNVPKFGNFIKDSRRRLDIEIKRRFMEEIEQMAFFKYGARPHWAKNRNLAFMNVWTKYPNFDKFVAVKKQLDPENMFSGDWSDEILFGKGRVRSDGCALEGFCVCSEDGHCSPRVLLQTRACL
ncbi:hypothetical protein F3Y22_tig00112259pilonHSYRG00060 [Hibiscus syriacus]|uniref:FAD-binding PCMH-type domain-containing protein n=1 Tax=Hibiscus syriacus TaxID=106335 RepID=A0A6A2XH35_HIBSY|nr:hypothetical protein F3Y22_tig00112259pilonHSYRG00060 [Hibiscus syriacus]